MSQDSSSFVKEVEIFDPISEHLNDNHPTNIITDEHSSKETCYDVNCVPTEADIRNRLKIIILDSLIQTVMIT